MSIYKLSLKNTLVTLPLIKGKFNNTSENILLDSGAEANCFSSCFIRITYPMHCLNKYVKIVDSKPILRTAKKEILPVFSVTNRKIW